MKDFFYSIKILEVVNNKHIFFFKKIQFFNWCDTCNYFWVKIVYTKCMCIKCIIVFLNLYSLHCMIHILKKNVTPGEITYKEIQHVYNCNYIMNNSIMNYLETALIVVSWWIMSGWHHWSMSSWDYLTQSLLTVWWKS